MTKPAPQDYLNPYLLNRAQEEGISVDTLESALSKIVDSGKIWLTEPERNLWIWCSTAWGDYLETKPAPVAQDYLGPYILYRSHKEGMSPATLEAMLSKLIDSGWEALSESERSVWSWFNTAWEVFLKTSASRSVQSSLNPFILGQVRQTGVSAATLQAVVKKLRNSGVDSLTGPEREVWACFNTAWAAYREAAHPNWKEAGIQASLTPYVLKRAQEAGISVDTLKSTLNKYMDSGKDSMTEQERDAWSWLNTTGAEYRETAEAEADFRVAFKVRAPSVHFVDDGTFEEQVAQSQTAVLVCFADSNQLGPCDKILEHLAQEHGELLKVCALNLHSNPQTAQRFVLGGKGPYLMIFWRRRLMSHRSLDELGRGLEGLRGGLQTWLGPHLQHYEGYQNARNARLARA